MDSSFSFNHSLYRLIILFQFIGFSSLSQELDSLRSSKQHFSYKKNHYSVGLNDIARGCIIVHYERVIKQHFGVEFGAGLTFDDWYALNYWEGEQYIKRTKGADTRFTYSFNLRCVPIKKVSFLYISVGWWYRKYYSADKEAFFYYNGHWIGSKRVELNYKLMIGNFFNFGEHFLLDYYAGVGIRHRNDIWSDVSGYPTTFVDGKENVNEPALYLGLRIGFSF
jgi:hypothetical protein